MSAAPAAVTDTSCNATFVASEEANRVKGFLGTADEMTAVADTLSPHSVAWVQSLSDAELLPLGEKALHDIADDILVLDEIRQRFRRTPSILGYNGWKDFVAQNSRYSIKTIQRRLQEVHGKEESKANRAPGNMYTRSLKEPSAVTPELQSLKESNPEVFQRVQAGTLKMRTPKPKSRADYTEKDYFRRVGAGLANAFSGVDERLTELTHIKKSEWTADSEEGVKCIILNLKEVSQKANEYAVRLKAVLKRNA